MKYEEMLKKARRELPAESFVEVGRFEVPNVRGHTEGSRTVISNFYQIADVLRREPGHLLKFLLTELATPGELRKTDLVLGRKISAAQINEKIARYVNEFVLCPECRKPDTKLVKEDRVTFIRCMVCGSKKPVRSIK